MDPIPLRIPPEDAMKRLKRILADRGRTEVVEDSDRYLHVTETSALFRFKDDIEIEIDEEAKRIHLRSASRLGWSDLGVNRRRMASLRAAYEAAAFEKAAYDEGA